MTTCLVCGQEVKLLKSHLKQHNLTPQEYYDKYLKKEGDGVCVVCGKETQFAKNRYRECCSLSCAASNPKRQEKIRKTNLEKYGCINAFQSNNNSHTEAANLKRVESMTKTNLEKYGVKTALALPEVQEKARTNSHTKEADNKRLQIFIDNADEFEKQNDCIRMTKLFHIYGKYVKEIRDKLEIITVGQFHFVKNSSIPIIEEYTSIRFENGKKKPFLEFEVLEYIKTVYNGTIITSDHSILGRKELDIYIPEKKLAIECNGIYWHSDEFKDPKYHLEKSIDCQEKGIRLIHIYETDWLERQDKVKQLLNIALGYTSRIYARQCEVHLIDNQTARPFNEATHMQNHRNAKITYGLFYKDELVQLMSFSHTKYNRNLKNEDEYEIIRGCPGSNNIVVGGVSKLFKHFIREHQPKKIFSYCDFNLFDGRSYEAIGMKFDGYTGPNKWWIIDDKMVPRNPSRYHEYKALSTGIIWGAGSKKYIWEAES